MNWLPPAALLGLLWLDVLTHAPRQNPTVARAAYEPELAKMEPRPRLGESRAMVSPSASYQLFYTMLTNQFDDFTFHRLGMVANANLLDGIPKVDGFFSLYVREERPVRLLLYADNHCFPQPLADFASVSQVTVAAESRAEVDFVTMKLVSPCAPMNSVPSFFIAIVPQNGDPGMTVQFSKVSSSSVERVNDPLAQIPRPGLQKA